MRTTLALLTLALTALAAPGRAHHSFAVGGGMGRRGAVNSAAGTDTGPMCESPRHPSPYPCRRQ